VQALAPLWRATRIRARARFRGGDSIAHYTTDAGAIGITEDQEITPGKSGAVIPHTRSLRYREEAEDKLVWTGADWLLCHTSGSHIGPRGPQPVAEKPWEQ